MRVHRKARYVNEEICTGCGNCASVCPIEVSNPFDMGLSTRKASYRFSAQSVPGAYVIEKKGIAPCRDACPTDQRAQGYIALIRQKRYADAYWAIRREHPFPSVCGRVCNHRCEDACSRGKYDEPVNIMGLKRFVADWAYENRRELPNLRDKSIVGTQFQHNPALTGKKIAIIGAGPAGLTAALDLIRLGHAVTVFDALPVAGGMMRVGIPPHRLPTELLDWEIQQIVNEGVDLRLNTWVDDVPALLENGYQAVLIAIGAHVAKKLSIRNSNHPDNWMSLNVLRKACLGEPMNLSGKKVIVLGGGNVALDTSRTVLRLGAKEVRMACLESRGEMPGFQWEVGVAEEEGVQMFPGRTFKEIIVKNNKIIGVRCMEVVFHGFKHGRPNIAEIPGTEHTLPADIVVWAIGQGPDFSFLPQDGSINTRFPVGVQSDEDMRTTMKGVFVAGDVRRGVTFFVVDAIGEGHKAARSIDRYLRGDKGLKEPYKLPAVTLSSEDIESKFETGETSRKARIPIKSIPLQARVHNFREVDKTLTEEEALAEAERCLHCG
ncbi:MAG: FAD-dependent oxidoreductase, partial [Anaerolineales bacterium]|nr:FAD-dependent oxidoreductase [Anaerolineales bacterium]